MATHNTNKERIQKIIDGLPVGTKFTARDLSVMFGKQSPPIQAYGRLLMGMERIICLPSRRGEANTYMRVEGE